ncbi:hypothetical protein ILYODFUR_010272 [Ilyodon furcidens]|uniref:Uncharacterized protein n=1 Tax=Ilyodon furcidens TaxID=33524 RepID=A0ABV0V1V8_9TELE
MFGPELCCCCETSAALFCSTEATPPRVSLQWHHTVPTVSASAHLHVTLLVSKLSQFMDSSARPTREQGEAKDWIPMPDLVFEESSSTWMFLSLEKDFLAT